MAKEHGGISWFVLKDDNPLLKETVPATILVYDGIAIFNRARSAIICNGQVLSTSKDYKVNKRIYL